MTGSMQQGSFEEVDVLGKRLSSVIGCAVKWPGYDKNVFVCNHDVTFAIYKLKGSSDWTWAKKDHDEVAGGK